MQQGNPQSGMMARVRNRLGIVTDVNRFPSRDEGDVHFVRVEYTDYHDPKDEFILWEREPYPYLWEPYALPEVDTNDPMEYGMFDALQRATRWSALTPFLDPAPIPQKQIDIGPPHNSTYPDFFYEDPDGIEPGICIYLDGMSNHIHGNPATQQGDREIRQALKERDYIVLEITASELDDKGAMIKYFKKLGRQLIGRSKAQELAQDTSWFGGNETANE